MGGDGESVANGLVDFFDGEARGGKGFVVGFVVRFVVEAGALPEKSSSSSAKGLDITQEWR